MAVENPIDRIHVLMGTPPIAGAALGFTAGTLNGRAIEGAFLGMLAGFFADWLIIREFIKFYSEN